LVLQVAVIDYPRKADILIMILFDRLLVVETLAWFGVLDCRMLVSLNPEKTRVNGLLRLRNLRKEGTLNET
jgi:hypothetical protein